MPTAPTTLERWFPIAVWLPKYNWGKFLMVDLIAAISVAALLIPESMGHATVAGLPVQIGLYLAPLALIGYAMFDGSRILVFAIHDRYWTGIIGRLNNGGLIGHP